MTNRIYNWSIREDGSVARSFGEVDADGSAPASLNELAAGILDEENAKLAEEYAGQFDDGNTKISEVFSVKWSS